MEIIINIANQYTKTPGGRYASEGNFSGEEFRKNFLRPAYEETKKSGGELTINLDGGYGYPTSFLEEAFGGLARETKDPYVLKFHFISEEEPSLIENIKAYMRDGLQ